MARIAEKGKGIARERFGIWEKGSRISLRLCINALRVAFQRERNKKLQTQKKRKNFLFHGILKTFETLLYLFSILKIEELTKGQLTKESGAIFSVVEEKFIIWVEILVFTLFLFWGFSQLSIS